ncbi:MAG: cytochrome c3 family protein [Candidatus Bipolaricaulia bacterium]
MSDSQTRIFLRVFLGLLLVWKVPGIPEGLPNEPCMICHQNVDLNATVHEGTRCTDCHQDIKALPHPVPAKRIDCGLCHQDMTQRFELDVHARARERGNTQAPDCTLCHGEHEIYPRSSPESPLHPQNIERFCSTCHMDVAASETYHVETQFDRNTCQRCHGIQGGPFPFVDVEMYQASIHKDLECIDCHRGIGRLPHATTLESVRCGLCHRSAEALYQESIHAEAIGEGIEEAAHCWDCHGTHNILPGREMGSLIYPQNLPSTCGRCHSDPELAQKYGIPIENPYELYEKSVHAQALAQGNIDVATCTNCHGSHEIRPLTELKSSIHKGNIPKTCSQCHEPVYENYVQSIHWKGYVTGVREAPVCNDCHLEHAILSPEDPGSPVYPRNIPITCADCHRNVRITERYGIPAMRLETYLSSYHGLALRGGNLTVANCSSCHGAHKILPSSDSASWVNPNNLPQTCGQCHPGVGEQTVLVGKIHTDEPGTGGQIIGLVRRIYIGLIGFTVGGMFLHNVVDFFRKMGERGGTLHVHPHPHPHPHAHASPPSESEAFYLRFNRLERFLHVAMLVSFIVLAYTGFARRYPDSLWVAPVMSLGGDPVRGFIHRVAAVILLASIVVQLLLIIFTQRGREQLRALLPRMQDLRDAVQLVGYNLGLLSERPRFHRFSYIEKIEYWALIWGTMVMGLTGFSLWLENITLRFLPEWWIDLFILTHFYEAILAVLAILIWHFYWVIFNPDVYPMDMVWISGTVSLERMEEEHPLELEESDRRSEVH